MPLSTPFAIGSDVWPGVSKLIEEIGELGQVLGKLIAMGGDADTPHWDGEGALRQRLVDEMGDVMAALAFLGEKNDLDPELMIVRAGTKKDLFDKWHEEQA